MGGVCVWGGGVEPPGDYASGQLMEAHMGITRIAIPPTKIPPAHPAGELGIMDRMLRRRDNGRRENHLRIAGKIRRAGGSSGIPS